MLFRPKSKDVDPSERAVWGDLLSLGMVFPIAIALGYFIGRWIGGLLGHREAGQYVGLVWGVATGFWELYKVNAKVGRMEQREQERKEAERRPGAADEDGDVSGDGHGSPRD